MIGVVNDKLGSGGSVPAIFLLLSIGPNYATAVRRCHDLDRSGWSALSWFALWFRRGTIGDNQFGPEPAGVSFQWLKLDKSGDG